MHDHQQSTVAYGNTKITQQALNVTESPDRFVTYYTKEKERKKKKEKKLMNYLP